MKKVLTILLLLCTVSLSGNAQDSLSVTKAPRLINDYSLVGVNYGVTFSSMYFSPTRYGLTPLFAPNYISVTYTKYSKMFDSLPYFGLVIGGSYGREGFAFEVDEETGHAPDVDGASRCSIEVFEIPAMAQMHFDFEPAKIMANVGVYGGWRNSITRSGENLDKTYANKFRVYEHQIDYGLQGGLGFALMFDPIEIHFNALVRWSWSSLYDPDYASKYYYRYAYPLDIMASVGIHFQLTKRNGKTSHQLRREARDIVYNGKTKDSSGSDR